MLPKSYIEFDELIATSLRTCGEPVASMFSAKRFVRGAPLENSYIMDRRRNWFVVNVLTTAISKHTLKTRGLEYKLGNDSTVFAGAGEVTKSLKLCVLSFIEFRNTFMKAEWKGSNADKTQSCGNIS